MTVLGVEGIEDGFMGSSGRWKVEGGMFDEGNQSRMSLEGPSYE